MEAGILFADVRGFTSLSERESSAELTQGLTQFYSVANKVLARDDALLDFIGDQVMAIYLPAFPGLRERTAQVMLDGARRLVEATHSSDADEPFRVGVGMNYGMVSVGNVNKGATIDFTAVGDVVNTAARLQAVAKAGEIVISDSVYERVDAPTDARSQQFTVKGKSEPVEAFVIAG